MSDPSERRLAFRGLTSRSRAILIGVGFLLVVLAFSLRGIAEAYTDYLWFDSLDAGVIWQRRLGMQTVLAASFGLAFFVFFYVNLVLVDRLAPLDVVFEPGHPVERYRELLAPRQRRFRLIISLVFAVLAGAGSAGEWRSWLLFRYGGDFGTKDALHGVDLGFYVFKLPFLSYAVGWAFATVLVVTTAVSLLHYATGGLRLPGAGPAASDAVKGHLSGLLALLALIKAADYWLDRSRLATGDSGFVRGALYTDVEARLPATQLLLLVSLLCAVLLVINVRRRGWGLPLVAAALWVILSLLVGVGYPWFVQQFDVEANPTALERPYIDRNIKATRAAFGLDRVRERSYDYAAELADQDITDNGATIRNVRLLDPALVPQTFSALESKLDYYQFTDLAVDRYQIDGQLTQVILGARELRPAGIPRATWETTHLVYTHGYGVAVAPTNGVNADGEPDFVAGGVPARVDSNAQALELDRPEIYFGRRDAGDRRDYAIVATERKEKSGQGETSYAGGGGVLVDSFIRKAAFALRFGDIEPLISNYLTPKSRVLYVRDVRDRVRSLAPFLRWDNDPYPVVVGGRIVYVVDGYTTSNSVPYADTADTSDLALDADLRSEPFNYIRNSVKAVVDAYDGTVKLYLTDELTGGRQDPIIRAYAAAFPELFTSISSMPAALMDHLRYPEDLFKVQTTKWTRYHISDPAEFYTASDAWAVSSSPPSQLSRSGTPSTSQSGPIDPYFLMMRLPDGDMNEFVLFRPFSPLAESEDDPKKQLTSFMVAKNGATNIGELEVYTMTQRSEGREERNRAVLGPLAVHEKMISDTRVSQELTLLSGSGGGSVAELGNMVIVPIEQGLLYVRPVYVKGENNTAPPRLRKVIVVVGDRTAIGSSLAEALGTLYPDARPETLEGGEAAPNGDAGGTPDGGEGDTADDPSALISRAVELLDEADATLREKGADGLAEYETARSEAFDLIRRANQLLGNAGATSGRPSSTATSTSVPPASTTTTGAG